jgi:hypothetical protein
MEKQKASSSSRGTGLDGPKLLKFTMIMMRKRRMVMVVKYLLFKLSMGNSLICISLFPTI